MLRFMIRTSAVLLVGFLLLPPAVHAQGTWILLHSRPNHTGACTPESQGGAEPTDLPCSSYDTSALVGEGTLIYLVAHTTVETGVRGLSCGIDYSGSFSGIPSDYVSFDYCGDGLVFPSPDWPGPGSGTRITWSTCQDTDVGGEGVNAIAGAFYVYAYGMDTFKVIENNTYTAGPELLVADCNASVISLDPNTDVASVAFTSDGSVAGATPCGNGPVQPPDPVELLQELVAEVMNLNLDSGVDNSLDSKLSVALGALQDMQSGNDGSAINLIQSFISEVEAQAGTQITQAVADQLVAEANAILQLLDQASTMATGMQGVPIRPSILASPNPSRSDTRIHFTLPRDGDVRVGIFDVQGRKVVDLFQGRLPAGAHDLAWDGKTSAGGRAVPGVYMARLDARGASLQTRLVRLR